MEDNGRNMQFMGIISKNEKIYNYKLCKTN